MHIARQTPEELVVVSGSRWVSAMFAAGALITVYFVISHHKPKNLFATAFFVIVALLFDLRKIFTFDGMQRIVRWKGRKVLKAEAGEIPFDDITDIRPQSTLAGKGNTRVYRLTIVTPRGTIPMAYTYNGQPDGYSALRGQILEFVRPGSTGQSSEPGGLQQ
jgi:hypothetical protein